ncbi:hypothetical protein CC80DRAFT_553042 [Byssothecium circinans]|uniref:Uncharacterized protein n=1 Tax=Byssothecium circinans TaxID=147558 RepID=A0A6A5TLG9_9PLEO|nr:hypothetical protein CC80DRAFT_553042 [Byssothecium circinans]
MSQPMPIALPTPAGPRAPPPPISARCDMCAIPLKDYLPTRIRRCVLCSKLIKDWTLCTRWPDLLELNREFIQGKRPATPYAAYPIFKDHSLHPGLLRLHDFGFLVTDAQGEMVRKGQEESGAHMGKWYEVKERSYLTCVLPTNDVHISKVKIDELIYRLFFEMRDQIEFVSYFEYAEYEKGGDVEGRYIAPPKGTTQDQLNRDMLVRYKMFYSSVGPSNALYTIAKHRWALTEEELKWKPWKRCKHNELPVVTEADIPKNSMGTRAFGQQLPMSLGMKPLIITIANRNWPPTGKDLQALLVETCVSVELEPIYAKQQNDGERQDGAGQAGTTPTAEQQVGRPAPTVPSRPRASTLPPIAQDPLPKQTEVGQVPMTPTGRTTVQSGGTGMVHTLETPDGRTSSWTVRKKGNSSEEEQTGVGERMRDRSGHGEDVQGKDDDGKAEARLTEKFNILSLMEDVD